MVVLSITGLAVGVIVLEQSAPSSNLRLHQDALNRASRLGTMGEFAAAVAHEINQPLTAIGNYSRLAKSAAEQVPPDSAAAARGGAERIEQVDRAAAVIQRLRELIGTGRIERRLRLACARCSRRPIRSAGRSSNAPTSSWKFASPAICRRSSRMPLQVEQVLLNLIRNSRRRWSRPAGRTAAS